VDVRLKLTFRNYTFPEEQIVSLHLKKCSFCVRLSYEVLLDGSEKFDIQYGGDIYFEESSVLLPLIRPNV